MILAHPV